MAEEREYTTVPNAVLHDPSLSPGAKVTYMVILMHQATSPDKPLRRRALAENLGVCDRSVRLYLEELAQHDLYPLDRSGDIYVLQAGDRFKIGRARNASKRIEAHRSSSPVDLDVVMVRRVLDCVAVETSLHHRFLAKQVKPEWFTLNASDIDVIRQVLAENAADD